MITYWDLISHDEMFFDIYKIQEITNRLCLEVEGKMVSRTEGTIDDSFIGGNTSVKGPEGEGTDATAIPGVDIVINHHLVKPFMRRTAEQIKHILPNFKNYQFFIGENMNPDGMVALLDFREDGVTPYMIFFKDVLEMEKC
uniref:Translationally-controlled tumor protein n=1 Tax=Vombatus ursinus TaxID=29139 RepID=A0A4X2LTQ9_VOMUR